MIEVINELYKNSRSESTMWEVEWSRHEVRVVAYLQDWDYAYNRGKFESRSHTFSRMEVDLSEIPLDKMVGALDKFKPLLKEDDAS